MRICFFHLKAHAIFDAKSEAPIGGTLVQMRVVAEKLAEDQKNQVFFLVGNFGQPETETHGNIRVFGSVRMERSLWNVAMAPLRLWRDLKTINADVYVASSAGPEIGIMALFCLLLGKRMVYRVAHEWDCTGEYVRSHGFSGWLFGWGLRHASAVVAQGDDQKDLLWKQYSIRAVVIRNSYDLSSKDAVSADGKHGVLWVSRCDHWKRPEFFLELARSFPKEAFTMICPKQKYQEAFFDEIRSVAVALQNVTFVEFVPYEEIQKYFDQAKVFVGTSDYEGFPNTYIQACMGGTPIVSFRVNPDHFIDTHNIGFTADGDRAVLVQRLKSLLENDVLWKEQSQNARRYVRTYHDIERNIQKWQDVFAFKI